MKHETTYRLGVPQEIEVYEDVFEMEVPVNKVVTVTDGKASYIKMEKRVAGSLAQFRERFPNEPVEGAPVEDGLAVVLSGVSDEQLARLGLTRSEETSSDEEAGEVFASEEAYHMAAESGLLLEDLPVGKGRGKNGLINTVDVREAVAEHGAPALTE